MHFTALLTVAAGVGGAMAQGVFEAIPPKGSPPAGCLQSTPGTFELSIQQASGAAPARFVRRDITDGQTLSKRFRQAVNPDDPYVGQRNVLQVSISNGIIKDATGATGYIADNRQFQFDNPPQTGAIYTAGWSFCPNGTLALGPRTVFVQCLSGSFYNLYDVNPAGQCVPVYLAVHAVPGSSATLGVPPPPPPRSTPPPSPTSSLFLALTSSVLLEVSPFTTAVGLKATGTLTSTGDAAAVTDFSSIRVNNTSIELTSTTTTAVLRSNTTISNTTTTLGSTSRTPPSPTSAPPPSTSSSGLAGVGYLPPVFGAYLAMLIGLLAI